MSIAPVEPYVVPFTVLVDSNESQPFTFQNLLGDADVNGRPLVVATQWCSLGRYPNSLGDYSIDGYQGRVAVERKAMEDAWGTLLGWENDYQRNRELPGRRQRFEKELANLAATEASLVVVEASLETCLRLMPEWGTKPALTNSKIFLRSVLAYMQDYKVPWLFCDGRRLAEVATFRFLQRYWRKQQEVNKGEKIA